MVALDAANRSSDTIACQSKARSGAMTILSSYESQSMRLWKIKVRLHGDTPAQR
jgi:hypothetical protein